MVPCPKVHGGSATAEFRNDPEEAHVEVAHQYLHSEIINLSPEPLPELGPFPLHFRFICKRMVHVHHHDDVLVPNEAHVLVQEDLHDNAACPFNALFIAANVEVSVRRRAVPVELQRVR